MGRSSLEKASGWMRLPRPAAGMMPHMSGLHRLALAGAGARRFESENEITRSFLRRMIGKRAFAGVLTNTTQLAIAQIERSERIRFALCHQDFRSPSKKSIQPVPVI